MSSQQSLQYSNTSNPNKLLQSLSFLPKLRQLNTKPQTLISPLQKYIRTDQITYIDNQKLYGIVKVKDYMDLKQKIKDMEANFQEYHIQRHEDKLISQRLQIQLQATAKRQEDLRNVVEEFKIIIQNIVQQRNSTQKLLQTKNKQILQLINDGNYITNEISQLRLKLYQKQQNASLSRLSFLYQTQTQAYLPLLKISQYNPSIQSLLRKTNEPLNKPSIKQIIQQSLQQFVRNLKQQYSLIEKQNIDLDKIRYENQDLKKQNQQFKKIVEQTKIQEQKVNVLKNCIQKFLDQTNKQIIKQIQTDRSSNDIKSVNPNDIQHLLNQKSSDQQTLNVQNYLEFKTTQQIKICQLKQENLGLLKKIGQYQYKWKNLQKVLQEKNHQTQISDDGTVGQLVKISKMIKQSIKGLLQDI